MGKPRSPKGQRRHARQKKENGSTEELASECSEGSRPKSAPAGSRPKSGTRRNDQVNLAKRFMQQHQLESNGYVGQMRPKSAPSPERQRVVQNGHGRSRPQSAKVGRRRRSPPALNETNTQTGSSVRQGTSETIHTDVRRPSRRKVAFQDKQEAPPEGDSVEVEVIRCP